MTTIAYSAGVMAADTQVTAGNRKFRTTKVSRLKDGGLFASSGNMAHGLRIKRWVEAGFPEDDKPDFDEADFECLIVKGDGTVYLLDEEMELLPFKDSFIAIGSGSPYATAAMALGQTPAQAVALASRFDPATSEPVEEFHLKPIRKPIRRRQKA